METVTPDLPPLGDLAVDRVSGCGSGQVVEEGGVEHRDVRQVRQCLAGHADPEDGGRVVQWRERGEVLECGDQRVVDDGRPVEIGPAVHHAVADGDQAAAEIGARLVEQVERRSQRGVVIGDPVLTGHPALTEREARRRRVLPDALDDAVGQGEPRIRLHQLEFDRRRSRIEDQNSAAHRSPWAWIAVIATVLTMSSTSAPRDRSLTGLFSPCRTGPMAMAPALRCTAL